MIPKIYHEVDYKFVSESSTETINIPNPMHCMEASIYVKDEWSVVAASIGASIRHICFFDAGAVVDNSNQTSEAYFRWMWKGEFSAWYTDAGLYVRHYHVKDIQSNRMWVKDIEALRGIAITSMRRKKRKAKNDSEGQYTNEELIMIEEDKKDSLWFKKGKKSKALELATDLKSLLNDVHGILPNDTRRQYEVVSSHVREDARGLGMFSSTVFAQWIGGFTKKPTFMKNAAMVESLKILLENLRRMNYEISTNNKALTVCILNDEDERGYKSFTEQANKVRQMWSLLPDPERRCIPEAIRSEIECFSKQVLSSLSNQNEVATYAYTHVARLKLDSWQLNGEMVVGKNDSTVIHGRQMIDKELAGVQSVGPLVFSQFYVCLNSTPS